MKFEHLPWQQAWLQQTRALTASHHHAWLLVGRSGDGVSQAAAALAASLLCLQPAQGIACGHCSSCRWLSGDAHPDFKSLQPDLGDGETVKLPTIKVEAVRGALDFMQLSAAGAAGRVLLVDPANALSRESANALLKALEEPPPNTHWLLVTAHPERLLPTIRSRALRVNLPTPTPEAARQWLQSEGVAPGRIETLLRQTRGEPLTACVMANAELADSRHEFVNDLLRPGQLPTLKWGAWVEAGPKAERRERFAGLLSALIDWTSDWSRVRAGLLPAVYAEQHSGLAALAPALPISEGLRYHRGLLRKQYLPDTTLSARLQFESILLDYRALFAR